MRATDIVITHPNARSTIERADMGWMPEFILAGLKTVRQGVERFRQRRALSFLDDRMLRDIGLTRLDVEREITKPFWQI
ncbi:MAG: DUF1127 domain-containing protein [Geminicoccaceae bacterium]